MAREIVLDAVFGLGNMREWSAAIRGEISNVAQAVTQANTTLTQQIVGNVTPSSQRNRSAGTFITGASTQTDAERNQFIQTTQIAKDSITGYKLELDKLTNRVTLKPVFTTDYISNIRQAVGDVKQFVAVNKELVPVMDQLNKVRLKAGLQREDLVNQALFLGEQRQVQTQFIAKSKTTSLKTPSGYTGSYEEFYQGYAEKQAELTRFNAELADNRKQQAAQRRRLRDINLTPTERLAAGDELTRLKSEEISNIDVEIARVRSDILRLSNLEPEVVAAYEDIVRGPKALVSVIDKETAKVSQDLRKIDRQEQQAIQKIQDDTALRYRYPAGTVIEGKKVGGRFAPGTLNVPDLFRQQQDALTRATVPADFENVLRNSPQLRRSLMSAGLGGGARLGTLDFANNFKAQGAEISKITRDITTGLTTVSGSFSRLNKDGTVAVGTLSNFSVQLDENNKVISRWGGRMTGAGTAIRQTLRDLAKYTEWMIASQSVMAALAIATRAFNDINTLNTNLTRFGITAGLSGKQAMDAFDGLAKVAYDTATPLNELVQAADDIALATRKAGQSTEQWNADILSLSKAVGILTNIAGIDTVKATDLLTAAFKQLAIAPKDVEGLLNKVTAAAGGQSNAIADIIQALGTVSEASKSAGLSTDELIASIQVLSQVTAKSPADVATAFKNLFGSLNSPASIKTLKDFGIQVKDSAGNLRPFLTIYKEIANAINSGIIPQGKVQDVLRAISGGPRRAPDAAAFLNNLGRINQVTALSFNASNEALIANGKLLDTNQAKLKQLGIAFDTEIFKKFGPQFTGAVSTLAKALEGLIKAIGSVPPGLISAAIGLGALVVALRLGTTVGGLFGRSVLGMINNLDQFIIKVKEAGVASALFGKEAFIGPVLPSTAGEMTGLGKLGAKLGSKGGKAIGLGVLGGITGAAMGTMGAGNGGNIFDTISGAGVGIGSSLSFLAPEVGVPIAIASQLLGFALGTGGLLKLGNNQDNTNSADKSTAEEVLNAAKNYQSALEQINGSDGLQNKLSTLGKQFVELSNKQHKTADETTQLDAVFGQYADTITQLTDAQKQLKSAQDDLSKVAPDIAKKYQFDSAAIKAKMLNPKEIQDVIDSVTKDYFSKIYPDLLPPDSTKLGQAPDFSQMTGLVPGDNTVTKSSMGEKLMYGGKSGAIKVPVSIPGMDLLDLTKTSDGWKNLDKIINSTGTEFTVAFDRTRPAVEAVSTAIQKMIDAIQSTDPTKAQNLKSLLLSLQQSSSAQMAADSFTKYADVRLTSLENFGVLRGGSAAKQRGEANIKLYNDLAAQLDGEVAKRKSDRYGGFIPTQRETDIRTALKGLTNSETGITTMAIPVRDMMKYVDLLGLVSPEMRDHVKLSLDEQAILLSNAGYALQYLNTTQNTTEAQAALNEEIKKGNDDILSQRAQLSADLYQKYMSGKITKNQFDSGEQQFKDANKVFSALEDLKKLQPLGFDQTEFQKAFSAIPGLEDAAIKNSDDFNKSLFNILATTDKNKVNFMTILAIIAGINASFKDKKATYTLDLKTRNVLSQIDPAAIPIVTAEGQAKADAAAAKAYYKQMADAVRTAVGAIGGSSSSSTGSSAAGTLDIPSEVGKATNSKDLLAEAIKEARSLQHSVPGADKEAKGAVVSLLNGMKVVETVRGVKEEFLRKALDNLAAIEKARLDQETKADMISRIRIGNGSFAAIANVPMNSNTGVSMGGPNGPVNINLNITGGVMTPAQRDDIINGLIANLKLKAS